MSIVIVVRHGRSSANVAGVLAGRTPGVHLDELGERQARTLGERLADVPLRAVVTSPLERCRQTVALAAPEHEPVTDERFMETDYGAWLGRPLAELAREDLWTTVQREPGRAAFPEGETMRAVRERVVAGVLDWNARMGENDVWLLASHGDPIAALLNWAVGADFDHVQRLGVDPGSASVVQLSAQGDPRVLAVNTHEGALGRWVSPPSSTVGGATGSST